MTQRPRFDVTRAYGRAASLGVGVVCLVLLGLWIGARAGHETWPRGPILAAVFAGPGLIGWLGDARRDRLLLVAAGIGCLAVCWVSYATLALAVVALLYFVAAGAAPPVAPGRRWLATPIIVVLLATGLPALLATSEDRCWLGYQTADGGIRYEDVADVEGVSMGGPGGPIGGGCDSGAFTTPGVLLALAAVATAVAVSVRASTTSLRAEP